jgi:hypothetical protein
LLVRIQQDPPNLNNNMNKLLILLTLLSLSVNADPLEDVWDWANDNPIATAAIVVGGGVTVGPIVAAYLSRW